MEKEYIFQFSGTKQEFLEEIEASFKNNGYNETYNYGEDYLFEIKGEEFLFGVERAGHSGGMWFISKIYEADNYIELRGYLDYIAADGTVGEKLKDKIQLTLLIIFLLPIVIIAFIVRFIIWIINKLRKNPKPETTEDKLIHLMEKILNCKQVQN